MSPLSFNCQSNHSSIGCVAPPMVEIAGRSSKDPMCVRREKESADMTDLDAAQARAERAVASFDAIVAMPAAERLNLLPPSVRRDVEELWELRRCADAKLRAEEKRKSDVLKAEIMDLVEARIAERCMPKPRWWFRAGIGRLRRAVG
jgi:hypothetical protein